MLPRIAAIGILILLLPFAWGLIDIVAALIDNEIGLVVGDAVSAVRAIPEGSADIATAVRLRDPNAKWSGVHDDDDSLWSVRVSAGDAEWCVLYDGLHRQIFPANRAAQRVAPTLGKGYEPLPEGCCWSCSGIGDSFKR